MSPLAKFKQFSDNICGQITIINMTPIRRLPVLTTREGWLLIRVGTVNHPNPNFVAAKVFRPLFPFPSGLQGGHLLVLYSVGEPSAQWHRFTRR